ncbi:MAG: hypothetical protein QOI77_22 [Blastocatellia bacterium]|jgi:uncharacterized protein YdhG (YjbR/CyaY superfamily)|nr:hypothetical protein [Blastocatellia bacterium]
MKKSDAANPPAKNVDEYLAGVPKEARATLEKLRKTIKAAAPMASEGISYQMPMYKHHGMVVGFAAFKNHCSIFPGAAVMDAYQEELKPYETSKGTIRFPANKPLPATLVKKLVRARIKENEARASRKK